MKTNIWKIAVAALAAASVLVGCAKQPEQGATASVSLKADAAFSNNAATLTLTLSEAAASEVSVTLGVEGDLASKLTWNPVAKIEKGAKTQTVAVTVNPDGLAAGTYSAKFAIKSVTGVTVGSPAEATVTLTVGESEVVPTVSIDAYDEAFADNKASLTLKLSAAAKADVSVALALATEYDDYNVIPASALTYTNPVTIAAGQTSATVDFTLDDAELPAGSNWLVVDIESAEGATVGSQKRAMIEAVKKIEAKLREDWSVEYAGEKEYEGSTVSVMSVSAGETDSWYLFMVDPEEIAEVGTLSDYIQSMEDYEIAPYIGTEYAYNIRTGATDILYNRFTVGEYTFYVFGCDEQGHLTGDYAQTSFSLEPDDVMKAAYDSWLGEWVLSRSSIQIVQDVQYVSYKISGILGSEYEVDAILGWDGELIIKNTMDIVKGVGFFGLTSSYNLWFGDMNVAVATLAEDGQSAQLVGLDSPDSSRGSFSMLAFLDYSDEENISFAVDGTVNLPATLNRPATEVDPNYAKWLGTWSVEGFDLPLTIAEDVTNQSFTMGLFYADLTPAYAIVDFDPETGNILYKFGQNGETVSDGTNSYGVYMIGVTDDNYYATGNSDGLLATFALTDDGNTAKIEGVSYAASESRPNVTTVQIGLSGYNSSAGFADLGFFDIPTTMTKQAASAGAPHVKAKKAGTSFITPLKSNKRIGTDVAKSFSSNRPLRVCGKVNR